MSLGGNGTQTASILGSLSPEEVDMLRDAFIYMDRDNDGHLNKDELLTMVRRCVGEERFGPLEEYLVPLFDVADKDKDHKLSLTEFLMSFADGPGVVPAEVINSCVSSIRVRLTDEEIATLQETFRRIDTKADGYIDKDELITALKENLKSRFPDLRDSNYNDIVAVIMASADADRDGRLCLSEFIRSFQEDQGVLPAAFVDVKAHQLVQQLTPAEINVLKEAFNVLDRNHDGYVEFSDIYDALWETLSNNIQDKSQIREICDLIMVTADRNKTGLLTLADLVRGFVQNISFTQMPVATAQEKIRSACEKLQNMLESGELEMLSIVQEEENDGIRCVNPNQLVNVLSNIFRDAFPMLDDETLAAVMGATIVASDNDINRKISIEDFIRCFEEGPRILSVDSSSAQQSISITDDELQIVSQVFQELGREADSEGCVQEPEVLEAIRNAFRSDPKQGDRVLQYVRDNIVRRNSSSSLAVEISIQEPSIESKKEPISNEEITEEVNKSNLENQDYSPSPKATTEFYETQPKTFTPALLTASPNLKPMTAVRTFGSNATVSDVLLKRHARRYLDTVYDTADTAVFEHELRTEFRKYANENQEFIDRDKFIKAYLAMEHYGLTPSESDVNRLLSRYCAGNKIMYDEFCVIMLQRARM